MSTQPEIQPSIFEDDGAQERNTRHAEIDKESMFKHVR